MSQVHVFSLKVGSSHGLWQYKLRGTHDRVMMHSLCHILNKTCQLRVPEIMAAIIPEILACSEEGQNGGAIEWKQPG